LFNIYGDVFQQLRGSKAGKSKATGVKSLGVGRVSKIRCMQSAQHKFDYARLPQYSTFVFLTKTRGSLKPMNVIANLFAFGTAAFFGVASLGAKKCGDQGCSVVA